MVLPDELLFREIIVKKVIHELGHSFGLPHCENKRCVCFLVIHCMIQILKEEHFVHFARIT